MIKTKPEMKLCSRSKKTLFFLQFFFWFWPTPLFAVQAHGGTEGLISHEIGHVLFIIGSGYFLYRIFRFRLKEPGWFEFKAFLWFIIAWNILTFSGHWMRELVDPEKFIRQNGQIQAFAVADLSDFYFYFTRLDHVLLFPAFALLLLALLKWRKLS